MFSEEIESYLMGLGFTYAWDVTYDSYWGLQAWYAENFSGDPVQFHITDKRISYYTYAQATGIDIDQHYYFDNREIDISNFDEFRKFFNYIVFEVGDVDYMIEAPERYDFIFREN